MCLFYKLTTEVVHLLYKCWALKATRFLFVGIFLFNSIIVNALPEDLSRYDIIEGGLSSIEDGAYVEGSSGRGGIQPDYRIDLESEPLKSLLNKAHLIRQQKLPYWDKVGLVIELMREDFFKYSNYYNPFYRRLLKKYRSSMSDVPLSEYGVCGAGVCREYALVLHFTLKAAGIDNKHGYAKIYRASRYDNYEITEDHAFTVVEHRGTKWVVDAYYWGFNGFRLQDLLSPQGITENSPHAPIADHGPGTRRIIKINSFPLIYNPKQEHSCSRIF